mgnify:CR=1 FL=1
MVIGVSLLVIGTLLGYLLRNQSKMLFINSRFTEGAIFLLLFFLGVSVGMNEQIMANLQHIGFQSLILTLFATIGSLLVTRVFYKFFFNRQ